MTTTPTIKRAKRNLGKPICLALLAILLIASVFAYRDFLWYSSHTKASDNELGKIITLLNLKSDQSIKLERYEFHYMPYWMDKFGCSASKITRTSNSPSWARMLDQWQKLDDMPNDFARVQILKWAADRLDKSAPFYYRWINTSFARRGDNGEVILAYNVPQLCTAFFDKDNPDMLYLCTEGDLMWSQVTISPGETTGTLDWSLPPWHSL